MPDLVLSYTRQNHDLSSYVQASGSPGAALRAWAEALRAEATHMCALADVLDTMPASNVRLESRSETDQQIVPARKLDVVPARKLDVVPSDDAKTDDNPRSEWFQRHGRFLADYRAALRAYRAVRNGKDPAGKVRERLLAACREQDHAAIQKIIAKRTYVTKAAA